VNGETIKSFLVGLGFDVDKSSLSRFNKAVFSATVKVAALYGAVQLASAGVFAGLSNMSEGFEEVGYQLRLVAPAINKFLILRQAMISAYSAAGINLTKAVQQSILFNYSVAKTKFALEAIYKSVGLKFLPILTQQMEIFRKLLFANMPRIQAILTTIVKTLLTLFQVTLELGYRAWTLLEDGYAIFKRLDEATGGWSTRVLEFIAVWKLLNLSFLATPFGLVLAGIVALIALYDDFRVWEKGGKSFFDWSEAVPVINQVKEGVRALIPYLKDLYESLKPNGSGGVSDIFKEIGLAQMAWFAVMALNPFGSFSSHIKGLIGLLAELGEEFLYVKWIEPWLTKIMGLIREWYGYGRDTVGAIANFLGGTNASAAVGYAGAPNPLSNYYQFGGAQTMNQKVDINLQSTADAWTLATQVSTQVDKSTLDGTRNMKGAFR
jgi:hypothetical protein